MTRPGIFFLLDAVIGEFRAVTRVPASIDKITAYTYLSEVKDEFGT